MVKVAIPVVAAP